MIVTFNRLLQKFPSRKKACIRRFERLMQAYLQTDPKYKSLFTKVWLWNDFFAKQDLGGHDTGIDLVAQTFNGDFWAIQCKCFQEDSYIDKPAVDTFLATNSLWISTSNKWTSNAEEAIKNQNPPVSRISLYDLQNAPVDWGQLEEGVHGDIA